MTQTADKTLCPIITATGPFYDQIIAQTNPDHTPSAIATALAAYDNGPDSDLVVYLLSQYTTMADVVAMGYPVDRVAIGSIVYFLQHAGNIPAFSLYREPVTVIPEGPVHD